MSESEKPLRPAVSPLRGKSNQWWYRLTAASFLIKVLLLVGIFFAVRYVAAPASTDDAQTETSPTVSDTATPASK